jgi:hypothetical protein
MAGGFMKKLLLVMMLVTTVTTVAQAETYRWTDSAGTVHFSDSPGEIPPAYGKSTDKGEKQTPTGSGSATQQTVDGNRTGLSLELSPRTADQAAIAHRVEGLQQRMMNDPGVMTLITPLLDDPEVQALLNDPAVLSAVQGGDIGTLLNNPAVLRLLNNPRIREIGKKLEGQGAGLP